MKNKILIATVLIITVLQASNIFAQSFDIDDTFNYQGELVDSGSPANGNYDMSVQAFTLLSGGATFGSLSTHLNTSVTNGLFTLNDVDLGNYIDGEDVYLEVSVRLAGSGSYTALAPRQKLKTVPYASSLTSNGATSGQVLTYSGGTWSPETPAPATASPWTVSGSDLSYSAAGEVSITSSGGGNTPLNLESTASLGVASFKGPSGMRNTYSEGNNFIGLIGSPGSDNSFEIGTPGNNSFKIFTGGDADTHTRVTVDGTGNVGIGTTTPSSLLELRALSPTGSILDVKNSSGFSRLEVSSNGGLNVGVGNLGNPPDRGIRVTGDAKQFRDANGMMKYMVNALCGSTTTLNRSYNGTTTIGAITASNPSVGNCRLNFPTDISNRFWYATAVDDAFLNINNVTVLCHAATNALNCHVENKDGGAVSAEINVLIF